jgi:hypothetical protein
MSTPLVGFARFAAVFSSASLAAVYIYGEALGNPFNPFVRNGSDSRDPTEVVSEMPDIVTSRSLERIPASSDPNLLRPPRSAFAFAADDAGGRAPINPTVPYTGYLVNWSDPYDLLYVVAGAPHSPTDRTGVGSDSETHPVLESLRSDVEWPPLPWLPGTSGSGNLGKHTFDPEPLPGWRRRVILSGSKSRAIYVLP